MVSGHFWIDDLPEQVWEKLPGRPRAYNEVFDERWEYRGSVREDDEVFHAFRHRAYRDLGHAPLHAIVQDSGPRLTHVFVPRPYSELVDLDGFLSGLDMEAR